MSKLIQGLLCAFFVAASSPATATVTAQAEARAGVWTGSLGGQKIVACFSRSGEAAYYYVKHFRNIDLNGADDGSAAWTEGRDYEATGRWQLRSVAPERMEGDWSEVKGKRTLPILLSRGYADKAGNGTCSMRDNALSAAFNGPRLDAQKIVRKAAVFQRRPYVKLSTLEGAIEGLALAETAPRTGAVNQVLAQLLSAAMQRYFECSGPNHDYNSGSTITFWSKDWLSIDESYEGYCGGAYPFHGVHKRSIDLASGKEVDLWSFFKHYNKDGSAVPPDLQKVILGGEGADTTDSDCGPMLLEERYFQAALGEKGMVFSTTFPHVAQACDMDITVPYARLQPFLTEPGRAALSKVRAR
ncbi:hypothetical protein [Janthinobacterium fluminis]|uniref:DUF3298 domain-containing protein n=1 Tax=Janthinobacterium fluminis TaxID=2987524 RepID=A0ABT5JVF8_9BURK|nr:hypothetical protein [Janthinobacterium fluminis]MDC8756160.1 hypothetical protein [Janthinobacterium fluminis]